MSTPCGPFLLEQPIGRGGAGEVWRGRHAPSGLPVAVKIVSARGALEQSFVQAFRGEVRAVAALQHPGVVAVYDHGVLGPGGPAPEGSPFLAMELGEAALAEVLPTRWEQAREVLADLLDALAHAHARGVLHRDLKPGNVLAFGASRTWKLADFGLARIGARSGVEIIAGTPAYMAPEQVLGEVEAEGPWTDLYALGCLAWELCAGRTPFQGSNQEVFRAQVAGALPRFEPRFPVPPELEGWLHLLLRKEPGARFQLAADARAQLPGLVLSGQPTDLEPSEDRRPPPAPLLEDWRAGLNPASALGAGVYDAGGLGLLALRPVPLLGREAERDVLWAALREARTQGGRLLLLRGPAGVGRTHLLGWLGEHAHATGAALSLLVPCAGDASALSGLCARLLAALGGVGLSRADLDLHLRQRHRLPEGEARALSALLRGEGAELSVGERRAILGAALSALAADRAVILAFDDATRAPDALELASALLSRSEPLPLLLILSVSIQDMLSDGELRSKVDAMVATPGARALELGPLPPERRRELLSTGLRLSNEAIGRIDAITGGDPGFAVGLVRHWAEAGALVRGPRGFELASGAGSPPGSLSQVWREALARRAPLQDPFTLWPLEIAATLGEELLLAEWTDAVRLAGLRPSPEPVERLLEGGLMIGRVLHAVPTPMPMKGAGGARRAVSAASGGLDAVEDLREQVRAGSSGGSAPTCWAGEGRVAFAHALAREALLAGARRGDRLERWHGACARMLKERGRAADPVRLARHLLGAGELEEALGALELAIGTLRRAGDYPAASLLVEEQRLALDALGLPPGDPAWTRWRVNRLGLLADRSLGDPAEVEAVVAEIRSRGPAGLLPRALGVLGNTLRARGRLGEALGVFREAVEVARAGGNTGELLDASSGLILALCNQGQLGEAELLARRSLEVALALGSPFYIGWARWRVGWVLRARGGTATARVELEGAERLAAEQGFLVLRACALLDLGEVARQEGRLEAAVPAYEEARRLMEVTGYSTAVLCTLNLCLVYALLERWGPPAELLPRMLHDRRVQEVPYLSAAAHQLSALVAAAGRDWAAYDRHLDETIRLLAEIGHAEADFAELSLRLARLAAAAGQRARALRARSLARDQLRRLGRADDVLGELDA